MREYRFIPSRVPRLDTYWRPCSPAQRANKITNLTMSDTSAVNAQYSNTATFTKENGPITNQWKVRVTNEYI